MCHRRNLRQKLRNEPIQLLFFGIRHHTLVASIANYREIIVLMEIHIPTPLRAYTDKQETVSVQGSTIAEGLAALITAHPALQQHLYTPEGKLRSFVNLYLNDDDVRYLPAKEDSPVSPTDELTIIPSIAGGCCR